MEVCWNLHQEFDESKRARQIPRQSTDVDRSRFRGGGIPPMMMPNEHAGKAKPNIRSHWIDKSGL